MSGLGELLEFPPGGRVSGTDLFEHAARALRAGRPVLVTDDADRENEGDVVLAASTLTPEWTAWAVRMSSGLLCVPMTGDRADRLRLPPMVDRNADPRRTAYTVTVDARAGVGTGISAADRTTTTRLLAQDSATAEDFIRPGHVLPLRAVDGGVLERNGHTEAAVDLCTLAGLPPVGLIAELVGDDGDMLRGAGIAELGRRFDLPVLTIAELQRYRALHPERFPAPRPAGRVIRLAETVLPTGFGRFRAVGYRDTYTGAEHLTLIRGGLPAGSVVRVHSECLTGEAFDSQRCECGPQLHQAMSLVAAGGGAVVYLRGHEGRGIGLLKKLEAYRLQDSGLDTVQANLQQGEPADAREYGAAAAILADLGLAQIDLLTNNPDKVAGLTAGGITVRRRIPLIVPPGPANLAYLRTKRDVLGHHLPA